MVGHASITPGRPPPCAAVSGGQESQQRRSYSVNMYPDFSDKSSTVTRLSLKLFQFARELAGYSQLEANDGQEPINAVFYKALPLE